jgi:hypothetical protein
MLNADLLKILNWAKQWLMTFNQNKTKSMRLNSRKQNKHAHPHFIMDNTQLDKVTSHKHLVIQLNNKLTWHEQIIYVKSQAYKRLNILRSFKFTLPFSTLKQLYTLYIRPILEYADIIWNTCTQLEARELENVQLEAARIVTGGTTLCSHHQLY